MSKCLAAVLLLAAFALAQRSPSSAAEPAQQLTIEAIFAEGGLTGRAPEAVQWSPDGKKVSYILKDNSGEKAQLWYVDVATEKPAVLVTEERLASLTAPESNLKNEREKERRSRYGVAAYHWAPDSKHLLFDRDGQLWLYNLASNTGVAFAATPGENAVDPKFSPKGERISYVRKHNLYIRPISGESEKQLTEDKDPNVLNGEVDWVYAEELDVRSNYFWSPDESKVVFMQMNETPVPTYPIEDFISINPTIDFQKYPKPGDPNPVVRLGVISSSGDGVKWIMLPEQKKRVEEGPAPGIGDSTDVYIPRFGWVRDGILYAQTLNRAQDKLNLYFIDVKSGNTKLILSESSPNWIEVNDDFRILKSGDHFLWSSWRDGHTHLYLYKFSGSDPVSADATLEKQLTQGDYEVSSVDGVDEAAQTVYFTANKGDARQEQLFSVRLDGSDLKQVSRVEGTHKTTFSDNAKYYVDDFSAIMTPPQLALCSDDGNCNPFWQSRSLTTYDLISPQLVEFKAEDGTTLYGELLLPPHAQAADAQNKIPLLMNPYGGPHGQVVRNVWGRETFLFHQILAHDGIAVLQVDNRGMGARGQKFASVLRHNFGEVELKDQLTALDQALEQFPQLDSTRLGWWGWSYGGYMTQFAMTHSDRFKSGVSVAPVSDWRDYDSIYTERYMGLPQHNEAGYKKSSPVNFARQLHGALLIAHGTGDDNVHLQNTIQMTQALIEAGKSFDLMLYPRKTHSISGPAARTHLFNKIKEHLESELLGK